MKKATILLIAIICMMAFTISTQAQKSLPTIAITTSTPLNAQEKVAAHMKTEGYDGPIGIKLRGNSSLGFNQKKYTIETRDADGKDLDVSLLGMPAHSKWVLLAPYTDVSMMRDPLAFQLWRDMGHWGPRTVMCEVTVDGEYRGIYILSEAIKKGKDRVDISKLKKGDTSGRELTGGYLLRIDTFNDDDATFTSKVPGIGEGNMSSEVIWSCIYPKKKNLQPEQFAYIQNYIDTVEQVIQSDYFADPQKGYAHYIDVPSFVDYFIHTELSLNADGYKRSAYFYKEKQHEDGTGGKLVAGPVWDYNLAYGNCNFANANNLEAWCFEGASNNPTPAMWQRLLQDPAFRKAVKTRYQQLRKNVLSTKAINAFIDSQAKLLSKAKDHHFETYPELLVSEERKQQLAQQPQIGGFPFGGGFPPMGEMPQGGFPQMGAFPQMGEMPSMGEGFPQMGQGFPQMGDFQFDMTGMFAAYRVSSYEEEIQILKQWLADRLAFLDRNIARFDTDWQPRIQPLVEKKMQFPFGNFPGGGFPSGGFPGGF
ncbi:CotH kinase family protein [uncultured Prevotella sp.]|uniref:CotH kinase family protein n=1 Tax=uncultured Prevotella sp. TaxID=159272 RepID=UPI0025CE0413|nr:CotH kinase family protein [uncultured Prevotella sp.]